MSWLAASAIADGDLMQFLSQGGLVLVGVFLVVWLVRSFIPRMEERHANEIERTRSDAREALTRVVEGFERSTAAIVSRLDRHENLMGRIVDKLDLSHIEDNGKS